MCFVRMPLLFHVTSPYHSESGSEYPYVCHVVIMVTWVPGFLKEGTRSDTNSVMMHLKKCKEYGKEYHKDILQLEFRRDTENTLLCLNEQGICLMLSANRTRLCYFTSVEC